MAPYPNDRRSLQLPDTTLTAAPPRPSLRGWSHLATVPLAIAGAIALVAVSGGNVARQISLAIYGVCLILLFSVSASYHRGPWSMKTRRVWGRLDHATIFLAIAGTYTPVGLIALRGTLQQVVLGIVWSGAALAIVLKLIWVRAPKWLSVVLAIALGWVGVAAMPQVLAHEGVAAVVLLACGGLAYTLGAIVYARRRPDPIPHVFGYHELFHAFTLVAVACQYVAIAFFVVRVD